MGTYSPQRRDGLVWNVNQPAESLDISKQQALELALLNVWKHFRFVPTAPDPVANLTMQMGLQLLDGSTPFYPFVAESVEIDQRSYRVEGPVKARHLGRQSVYRDVAAALVCIARASYQDWPDFNGHRSQMIQERSLDEFLGSTLYRNGQPDHGRPPMRFFCHNSPVVKLSSSQTR